VRDGEVVAHCEEERLNRVRHAPGYFPSGAMNFCLNEGGLTIEDIDYVVVPFQGAKYVNGYMQRFFESVHARYEVDERTLAWERSLKNWFAPDAVRGRIYVQLRRMYGDRCFPLLRMVNHHFAHAVPAFFGSPFEEALIITVDGFGEENATVVWHGRGSQITMLRQYTIPHSLGWFYSAFTEYLGFEAYDGEYKVMGLAAYGQWDDELKAKLDQVLRITRPGEYEVNPYFLFYGPHSYSERFTDALVHHLGHKPRSQKEEIANWHEKLAYAVQQRLEEVMLEIVRYHTEKTGIRRLCLSGGVALNVKMNGRLYSSGLLDDIFIHPLCSDAGQVIGGPMAHYHECVQLEGRSWRPATLQHVYLGPGYKDEEIEATPLGCGVRYEACEDISDRAADLLAQGKIVGWFQGRMESGPRALGNRSILADPREKAAQDRVNTAIKYREYWRPFCPSLNLEAVSEYLTKPTRCPFMILTFNVSEDIASRIRAVVHVDNTVRPQEVSKDVNPRYHRLIEAFARRTGVPVVLNTSFNVKGEPIVCKPTDALRTFFATGLDALAIGNCLVQK